MCLEIWQRDDSEDISESLRSGFGTGYISDSPSTMGTERFVDIWVFEADNAGKEGEDGQPIMVLPNI